MSVYSTCKTIQWEGERGMGQGARNRTRDARSATVPYVVPLPVSPTCNIFFNQHPLTLYTKKTEIYLAFSTHAPTHLWMVVLMWVFLFCLNALATVPNPFPCFYLHYHMNRKHEKKKKPWQSESLKEVAHTFLHFSLLSHLHLSQGVSLTCRLRSSTKVFTNWLSNLPV